MMVMVWGVLWMMNLRLESGSMRQEWRWWGGFDEPCMGCRSESRVRSVVTHPDTLWKWWMEEWNLNYCNLLSVFIFDSVEVKSGNLDEQFLINLTIRYILVPHFDLTQPIIIECDPLDSLGMRSWDSCVCRVQMFKKHDRSEIWTHAHKVKQLKSFMNLGGRTHSKLPP